MFCRDCRIPTCVFCVTTINKKHDITRLREIIENRKQQIVGDLKELEDVIVPAYKNVTTDVSSAELDKVLTAIQDHEDEMCRIWPMILATKCGMRLSSKNENLSSRTEKRWLWQQYLKRNCIKLSTQVKAF